MVFISLFYCLSNPYTQVIMNEKISDRNADIKGLNCKQSKKHRRKLYYLLPFITLERVNTQNPMLVKRDSISIHLLRWTWQISRGLSGEKLKKLWYKHKWVNVLYLRAMSYIDWKSQVERDIIRGCITSNVTFIFFKIVVTRAHISIWKLIFNIFIIVMCLSALRARYQKSNRN